MWSDTPPRLEVPVPQANSNVLLQFNGQPFQLYSVQTATNLSSGVAWANLGLGSNTSGNIFQFLHRGAISDPKRFYRIQLP
jgi:hypothetical protein